jgi:hypothetical protein
VNWHLLVRDGVFLFFCMVPRLTRVVIVDTNRLRLVLAAVLAVVAVAVVDM